MGQESFIVGSYDPSPRWATPNTGISTDCAKGIAHPKYDCWTPSSKGLTGHKADVRLLYFLEDNDISYLFNHLIVVKNPLKAYQMIGIQA